MSDEVLVFPPADPVNLTLVPIGEVDEPFAVVRRTYNDFAALEQAFATFALLKAATV
jgi:hypothetical protein